MRIAHILLASSAALAPAVVVAGVSRPAGVSPEVVPPSQNPDFVSLVEQLMVREGMSQAGEAKFAKYQFGLSFDEVRNLELSFEDSRTQSGFELRQTIDDFVAGMSSDYMAAWAGTIRLAGGEQYAEYVRIPEQDSAQASLDDAAAAADSVAIQLDRRETKWTDNQVVEILRGSRSVLLEPARSNLSWFQELDRTSTDWSSALDPVHDRPDQVVSVVQDGALYRLTYVSTTDLGDEFRTVYTFDGDNDFAPLSITSWIAGKIVKSEQYGYELALESEISRPSEILAYTIDQGGFARVRLYKVESWSDQVDPASVALRKPPFHMQINRMIPGAKPVLEVIKPPYLEGVSPADYSDVAVAYIINRLGSQDPQADYDGDGSVTEADILAAMDLFQAA